MTNRFKDFGSGNTANEEPLTFALHGEQFECYPAVPGKVLLSLVANTNEDDGAAMAKTIDSFFGIVLLPESYERFDKLAQDPKRIVTVETLGEIVAWLVEEYSGRPQSGPEDS